MSQSNTTKAALWWNKLRSRKKLNKTPLSIKRRGKIPMDYLILLPEHATESDLAKRFLDAMKNALGPRKKRNMKLLGPTGIGNLIEINNYNDFILYSEIIFQKAPASGVPTGLPSNKTVVQPLNKGA